MSTPFLLHPVRHADATGLSQTFETGCDVNSVAEDVAVLDDDVALIDADAELDALSRLDTRVALGHRLLHLRCTAQRIDECWRIRPAFRHRWS